jgi:uncharacterized protein (TIGR02757 family)
LDSLDAIKTLLEREAALRNRTEELCDERPDPLMIARPHKDQHHALTCALFAYGNAKAIVSFLSSLDPGVTDGEEEEIRRALEGKYYRFQNTEDVVQWHITLQRLIRAGGAENVYIIGYQNGGLTEGLRVLIDALYDLNPYRSKGYEFLIGKPLRAVAKASAMKRWMMYLRWMVRSDALDMGLWSGVNPSELIMPLDTHTFAVSRRLGLLQRRQCDLRAAIELTETLKAFDPADPLKYDFALYRIGQEKILF